MKFRKKPVVIEAFKFGVDEIPTWFLDDETVLGYDSKSCTIGTLEGEMTGRNGDWIIKGVHGELYPCKPDIFEATYELVEV